MMAKMTLINRKFIFNFLKTMMTRNTTSDIIGAGRVLLSINNDWHSERQEKWLFLTTDYGNY